MTDVVDGDKIEEIVGVPRSRYDHYGKAVSVERRVYILHSQVCLGLYPDLRDCPFSRTLDYGIDLRDWTEDQPVRLSIGHRDGTPRLIPAKAVAEHG